MEEVVDWLWPAWREWWADEVLETACRLSDYHYTYEWELECDDREQEVLLDLIEVTWVKTFDQYLLLLKELADTPDNFSGKLILA